MVAETVHSPDVGAASQWWLDRLVASAGDDDEALLVACRDHLAVVKAHEQAVLDIRDRAAARLRDHGVPMTVLGRLAGVSDSALARRILALPGQVRRVDRRKRR